MNPWGIPPILGGLAYVGVMVLVLHRGGTRAAKTFAIFLLAGTFTSFSAFMLMYNLSASTGYLVFWNNMVIVGVMWAMVAYYHFVRPHLSLRKRAPKEERRNSTHRLHKRTPAMVAKITDHVWTLRELLTFRPCITSTNQLTTGRAGGMRKAPGRGR